MIDKDLIRRIIAAGVCAPSGDNSQPWSFSIEDDTVRIFAHPEEDHAMLNIEGRGTYLATGALIENMVIAARHEGLQEDITLFPQKGGAALMRFSPAHSKGHRLFDFVRLRHTHRGAYEEGGSVPAEALSTIREPHCSVMVVTDRKDIRTIASAVSAMEEAALSTRTLHKLFFDSILWDAAENAKGVPGLYIRTTELPSPVQGLFRIIRYWPAQRFFNMLGLPRAAAKANASVYEKSAAIVAVVTDRALPEDFISAGRCMQRAWLELTESGCAAQPLAGALYLSAYLERTADKDFDDATVRRAHGARTSIEAGFGAPHGSVAMLLRCGLAPSPATARSLRRAPRYV